MAQDKNHHLVKRGETWYFRKMVNGRSMKKALSSSLTEARRQRDQMLKEIAVFGGVQAPEPVNDGGPVFGEVAREWIEIKRREIKSTTLRDYRCSMNHYILPRFGNFPIRNIGFLDIKRFITTMNCSGKRSNNVLVPMRSLFRHALLAGYIDKNPMDMVENLKVQKPDIHPLSMEEIRLFLEHVRPEYHDFFVVAFFTGMRFGEMAALKWRNVDFTHGFIRVRETRVNKEEGMPKTKGSIRDIKMLPPVVDAMRRQRKATMGKSEYVFLNMYGRPLYAHSVRLWAWTPALKSAGLEYRTLYQTRHTFATLMLDAGELPGWVQKMLGHNSLKMIYDRYYSYIKNYQRDEGSAFMENVYLAGTEAPEWVDGPGASDENFDPNLSQMEKGETAANHISPISLRKS